MKNPVSGLTNFLKEVRTELNYVNWLSKEDVIRYTLIVIGFSAVVALFLGSLDFLFAFLLNKFIIK